MLECDVLRNNSIPIHQDAYEDQQKMGSNYHHFDREEHNSIVGRKNVEKVE